MKSSFPQPGAYVRHEEVRILLDAAIDLLRISRGKRFRDRQIFAEVLNDTPETREAFRRFLHDVSTCPPQVIQWCQKQINTRNTRTH
jgi:hypothetical protein